MAGKGTVWVTEPDAYLEPKIGAKGTVAGELPRTVWQMLAETVDNFPNRPALCFKEIGEGQTAKDVPFTVMTWSEYREEIIKVGKSMIALELQPHQCTNIIGFNSKYWHLAQFGSMAAGGVPAGIYPTNGAEATKYITQHSEAPVVFLEDNRQLAKYVEMGASIKSLKAIVVWNEAPSTDAIGKRIRVYSWAEFMNLGETGSNQEVIERMDYQKPGHLSSLIYTSGTTGPPKAVMISHDNITWTVKTMSMDFTLMCENDRAVSFLPLSHIAAQLLDFYLPMLYGGAIYFAQPDALKGSLGLTLKEVRPTYFFGVPRVWEKIYEKMQEIGRSTTGLKKKIATWAKAKGSERNRLAQYGAGGGAPCGFGVANAVVLSKVKAALGLDACNYACVGAAPMGREVFDYFASLDIPIFEVFGQSESTGTHTVNAPGAWKLGTVGRPLPGSENKMADNGEYCFRSRNVMMGYMKMEEKTAETIDPEGWLHTGDVVKFDDDADDRVLSGLNGFVSITGRIKELIITAGGENIPPVLIEEQFKLAMPAISNCMCIGDKRKFLGMVLTLYLEPDASGAGFTNRLAGESLANSKAIGSAATTVDEVMGDEKWAAYFDAGMTTANSKATSNAQKVAKWVVVGTDFSEQGGMLTPTLKLKRGPTVKAFAQEIESMYK